MDEFLAAHGWDLNETLAGLAGGIVSILLARESKPWNIVASVMVAGLSSHYLAMMPQKMLPPTTPSEVAAFFAGLVGEPICRNIIYFAATYRPWARKNDE